MASISEIGVKIKILREQKGLSQRELGKILGCPQTTVAGWESQLRRLPRKELISPIANALNVSESYLLGVEREKYFEIPYLGELKNNCINKSKNENTSIEVTEQEYTPTRFAIKVLDNLFQPFIQKNDFCIIDNVSPKENDIVLIKFKGEYLLRKWKENKKRIALINMKIGFEDQVLFVIMKKEKEKMCFFIDGKECEYKGKLVTLKRYL